ncbi:peptidyl-prolyl cis-trans isomerase [Congregibacter sp.]|uniref:peptidylprolyl isomerase n=1 Tax=Congregibacter sp. TaxID=2744308 RepID=UPI0038581249
MTDRSPSPPRKGILKDPLFHFALIGLALFVSFVLLNDPSTDTNEITVSVAQQEQLVAAYTRVWRRPPNAEELKGLLDDWIREEIANREALTLGLAANDQVVRRRLRQKYESFMDQFAASIEPTDDELQNWYISNGDDYRRDARYSLRQRFFSSDRRDDAQADAASALAKIDVDDPELDGSLGDALAMPQRFDDNRETELSNRFGQAFTDSLGNLPQGRWSGPVPSAYGFHLVFLESAEPQTVPELDEVRAAVLRDWRAQHMEKARNSLYASLLERYSIDIQTPTAVSES